MNKKVAKNASWIIGCRIVQSVISMVISMISARYLGPANYGLINYVASVVAFVIPIMQLGFTKTIIQELVERPDNEGAVVGSALVFNLISAVGCMLLVFAFLSLSKPGETLTITVGVLYSTSLLFQAAEIVTYWFQYKLLSKYPSVVTLIAYTAVASYKVFLLVTGKSVEWFAVCAALEFLLVSLSLLILYRRMSDQRLSFSLKLACSMLERSKYYIVSTMMVTIFSFTDRVMLKLMIDESQTGFYSAAVTCASMTSFVFVAIIDSMRPVILGEKKVNGQNYEQNIIHLYSIITFLSLAQSILMTLLAKPIIMILYGGQYAASIPALRIVVWYTTFAYFGSVRNVWILSEGKQKVLPLVNLMGALANVALNFLLIPRWGVEGAAIASLITQIFTNFVIGFILPQLRYNNVLMIRGLSPKPAAAWIKTITENRRK